MSTEVGGHSILVQHWHESLEEGRRWAVLPHTDDRVVTSHYQVVRPARSKVQVKYQGHNNEVLLEIDFYSIFTGLCKSTYHYHALVQLCSEDPRGSSMKKISSSDYNAKFTVPRYSNSC